MVARLAIASMFSDDCGRRSVLRRLSSGPGLAILTSGLLRLLLKNAFSQVLHLNVSGCKSRDAASQCDPHWDSHSAKASGRSSHDDWDDCSDETTCRKSPVNFAFAVREFDWHLAPDEGHEGRLL